jgi:hypothetical protein
MIRGGLDDAGGERGAELEREVATGAGFDELGEPSAELGVQGAGAGHVSGEELEVDDGVGR